MLSNILLSFQVFAADVVIPAVQSKGDFDINFIFSVVIICASAIYLLIQLFGPSTSVKDETLRKSPYLVDLKNSLIEKIDTLKEDIKNKIDIIKKDITDGKDEITKIKEEISKIKIECNNILNISNNNSKTLEEMKIGNKNFVEKIDVILNEILELLDK